MKRNKKKGFTLIELVIVLAVLAIIALIAIPNFNKVRTDSQVKADKQTCEVIDNVATMEIANESINDEVTKGLITITFTATDGADKKGTVNDHSSLFQNNSLGKNGKEAFEAGVAEVRKPQVKGELVYGIIFVDGAVSSVKTYATEADAKTTAGITTPPTTTP